MIKNTDIFNTLYRLYIEYISTKVKTYNKTIILMIIKLEEIYTDLYG